MLQAVDSVYLSEVSPKDESWDTHRRDSDVIAKLYEKTVYHEYSERITGCSELLDYAFAIDDNGVYTLKLRNTWFCRVRHCPTCQWRRNLKWISKSLNVMPRVLTEYPNSRFILMTFTVANCELTDLRSTLDQMNGAWSRLIQRKEFKSVQGWIRSTEITRADDDKAHPHFHVLLMVSSTYFGNAYVSQKRWREVWAECMKISYDPQVHVTAVKADERKRTSEEKNFSDHPIMGALVETVKYAVKPDDFLVEKRNLQKPGQRVRVSNEDWLVGITKQLHKTRCIATGGVFKKYFKELEDELNEQRSKDKDLIYTNNDIAFANGEPIAERNCPTIPFEWNRKGKRYRLKPSYAG